MPWIYHTSEGPQGPISDEELKRLVADGTIYEQTPIKKAGSNADFVPAWNIKGLKFPEEQDPFLFTPGKLHPSKPTATLPPVNEPPQIPLQVKQAVTPTLKEYITPGFIAFLWWMSCVVFFIITIVSSVIAAVNGQNALIVAGYFGFASVVSLIVIRISLECVAVIFDISNYLKHLANK